MINHLQRNVWVYLCLIQIVIVFVVNKLYPAIHVNIIATFILGLVVTASTLYVLISSKIDKVKLIKTIPKDKRSEFMNISLKQKTLPTWVDIPSFKINKEIK